MKLQLFQSVSVVRLHFIIVFISFCIRSWLQIICQCFTLNRKILNGDLKSPTIPKQHWLVTKTLDQSVQSLTKLKCHVSLSSIKGVQKKPFGSSSHLHPRSPPGLPGNAAKPMGMQRRDLNLWGSSPPKERGPHRLSGPTPQARALVLCQSAEELKKGHQFVPSHDRGNLWLDTPECLGTFDVVRKITQKGLLWKMYIRLWYVRLSYDMGEQCR